MDCFKCFVYLGKYFQRKLSYVGPWKAFYKDINYMLKVKSIIEQEYCWIKYQYAILQIY